MNRKKEESDKNLKPKAIPFAGLRIGLFRAIATSLIVAEKSLENLWPALLWLCGFASLWLFQIPQWFGRTAEIGVSICFFIGAAYFLRQGFYRMALPRHRDVTRRIEQDSGLLHRPLSSLEDRLSNPARENTRMMWSAWQDKLHSALPGLRWPRPHPTASRIDPYALRALMLVILMIGFSVAGGAWGERLKHGMMPATFSASGGKPPEKVIVWITPPAYTKQPQIVLKGFGRKDSPVSIPEGSIIKARVDGWIGTPSLMLGDKSYPMQSLGNGSYAIERPVEPAESISIRQILIPRGRWFIAYAADTPPVIRMTGDPSVDSKGEMILPLKLKDDYAVENLTLRIRLDDVSASPPMGTPIEEIRSVMSPPQMDMEFSPQFDLAWHPWAGLNAIIELEATDHKGQSSFIRDLHVKLPERGFRHPVAKKLVEMRKRLIWTPEAAARNVLFEIESVMARPDSYHYDPVAFLALRSAASRLHYNEDNRAATSTVISLLWDIALKIDDGNFSMAQRSLRDAQQKLQNALRDPNTPPEEIAALMNDVREAMGNYLNEMVREMQKQMTESGAAEQMLNPESVMQNLNLDDLAGFLDKMQAEALTGDREKAREMLSQMERLMEMLDPSGRESGMPKDMQDMMETMARIQDLVEKQKALLAETQSQAESPTSQQSYSTPLPPDLDLLEKWGIHDMPPPPQNTATPPPPAQHTSGSRDKQEALRKTLGDLMLETGEKLGQIPDPMGKAEEAMRMSSASLGNNNPRESIPHQESAIKHLSEGRQQMKQQLAERMKQMMMLSFGMGPADPLGRPTGEHDGNAPWSASKVKIPDKAERKRVQDILEELRKKSGELQRPDYELDYYRRLMRQF